MLRSIVAVSALALAVAIPSGAAPGAPQDPAPASEGGVLLEHMKGLKKNLKGVAMSLQKSDSKQVLHHIAEMQRLVLLAKLEAPANLEEKPEDERESHSTEFRKDMIGLLQELAGMEIEVLDGELEKAFGRVTGSLYRLREAAHEKYQSSK